MAVNVNAQVRPLVKNIQAEITTLNQDIQVNFASGIIYAFSPTAKVEYENNEYIITITDKNGTTSAIIPVISEENINFFIYKYFEDNPVIQQYIQQHNISNQAHADIRQLLQQVIYNNDVLILDGGHANTIYS